MWGEWRERMVFEVKLKRRRRRMRWKRRAFWEFVRFGERKMVVGLEGLILLGKRAGGGGGGCGGSNWWCSSGER